jgi:hypothetical protein
VDESDALEGKKIVAAVMHRSSSADILKNVTHILEDRIKVKAQKCATLKFSGNTYRYALKSITVAHPFEKVLLVSDRGAVDVLINAG